MFGTGLSLPGDIAASKHPFWTPSGNNVPAKITWSDVPLLTGMKANIVPAVVQHGPTASEELARTWWKRLWFHPHARQLLDSSVLSPEAPVAIVANEEGKEIRYWSPHWQKGGVVTSNDTIFHPWESVCGSESHANELFLDNLGAWRDTRF